MTNCDKSSSLPDALIAFADDSTLGSKAGRTESDLCSKMMAFLKELSSGLM